jgi:hypothetical protein
MKRQSRIRLTPTDIAVLRAVAPRRLETYAELRNAALSQVSRAHSWAILKRLVQHRFLTAIRSDGGGVLGWSLTPKAKRLAQVLDDLPEFPQRAPVYKTSFHHDCVVREVRGVMEKSPAIRNWVPDHALQREFMRRMLEKGRRDSGENRLVIPDGIFEIQGPDGPTHGALEVEITQKSKERIYHKLEAHCVSQDFDYAFFVMRDEKLRDLFCEILAEVNRRSAWVRVARQVNGIYFTTLSEFRARGLHAPFHAETDVFTFAELGA